MSSTKVIPKLGRLCNNERLSDIVFLVGPNKRMIYSHRLLLASANESFRKMLYDDKTESGNIFPEPIIIPDLPPTGFLNMLKYLYEQEINYDLNDLYETYLAAQRFLVTGLIKKLEKIVEENTKPGKSILLLFKQVCRINATLPEFGMRLRKYIETDSETILKSDNFLQIDQTTLVGLLSLQNLTIDEFELLKLCTRWVDTQIGKQSLSCTKENKVKIFEPIKKRLKFSEITLDEITRFPEIEEFLSNDDMGKLLSSHLKSRPFPCETKRRAFKIYKLINPYCRSLVEGVRRLATYNLMNFTFKMSEKIKILSIKTTCPESEVIGFLGVTNYELSELVRASKKMFENTWTFYFNALVLQPEQFYELKFKVLSGISEKDRSETVKLTTVGNDKKYCCEILSCYSLVERIEFCPF